MTYPAVTSEQATLDLVLAGRSLARYGDGEFNICSGGHAKKQGYHWRLMDRLMGILKDSGDCMVGIPNLRSETPKRLFWSKYEAVAGLARRHYVSAFVTRPDSAPWIDTPEYWAQVERLWTGREVTLVRGGSLSLTAADLVGATVREVIAPSRDAWSGYDALLQRIGTPETAILCLGPTATVLAVDLCAKGVHAIDAGHLGLFRRKHLRGEPMTVTAADKAAA